MSDFTTLLAQAQLPEQLETLCLRGDLVARWQQLEQQLEDAKASPGASSLAGDGSAAIMEQMEALRQEMQAFTVQVRLRALPKRRFTDFLAEHPPRSDDRRDQVVGYNRETMAVALMRKCWVEPELTDSEFEQLQDLLSAGEWGKFERAVTALNFSEVSIPFSSAALRTPPS